MAGWAAALRGVLPSFGGRADAGGRALEAGAREKDSAALIESARALAPVVWLIGKVQSGKTSIIRAITQSSEAEVGEGFRASTRASRLYEFPSEAPVLRFLDTRGLGEAGYDPSEGLAFAEQSAHLVLATMRAMDPEQEAVIRALRLVRQRHPEWPIVIAQTCLHDAYKPGDGHTLPYPFDAKAPVSAINQIPIDLKRSLAFRRTLFEGLPGRAAPLFVPIDLTRPDDRLAPADYGLDALAEALASVAPAGLMAALSAMPGFVADPKSRAADPIVMGHAMAAAGGDLVPIPVAGALAVTTIQARLLGQLGRLYGIEWDRRAYAELSGALGAGTLIRMAPPARATARHRGLSVL